VVVDQIGELRRGEFGIAGDIIFGNGVLASSTTKESESNRGEGVKGSKSDKQGKGELGRG
jgi:hypothetical protein